MNQQLQDAINAKGEELKEAAKHLKSDAFYKSLYGITDFLDRQKLINEIAERVREDRRTEWLKWVLALLSGIGIGILIS